MKIFPAIDLKENKCVRLSKGRRQQVLYLIKTQLIKLNILKIKDAHVYILLILDSAFGRSGINNTTIEKIREGISIPIQIGGGIRSEKLLKIILI